jgi:hypothetical protein
VTGNRAQNVHSTLALLSKGIDTVASILIQMILHVASTLVGSTGGRDALVLLLEPVLLWQHSAVLARSTLNIYRLCLVCLELVCDVGLLGRCGGLGDGEFLDVALGVGGLDLRNLVVLELAEVQVLDEVGCGTNWVSTVGRRAIGMNHLSERPWE